jgi:hypothetical protein
MIQPGVVSLQRGTREESGSWFELSEFFALVEASTGDGRTRIRAAPSAPIADADGTLADLTTKFNGLLAHLRTVGVVGT